MSADVDLPTIGEIMYFAGTKPPAGWLECNGQKLSIRDYPKLYTILGMTYTLERGRGHFQVPDLRGKIGIGTGQGPGLTFRVIGHIDGAETISLSNSQMPAHRHQIKTSTGTTDPSGTSAIDTRKTKAHTAYPDALRQRGAGEAHDNMSPWIAIKAYIAWRGKMPGRR